MSDDLAFASAVELAELVRLKKVSPVELVDVFGARIEELNPRLGAYLTTTIDQARDEAKRAEATVNGGDLPPFFGVPISIKDLNETAGVRTTHGNGAFADRIPDEDDSVVTSIKQAGFIMLGKTNTPEFGTTCWTDPPAYFPARNPWDPERTTGGSSGGAAGALAAGLCPISQGSDGGGSIRIPAALCGLYGIKPSRGRVSSAPGAQSLLSQNGPISRTVADAAALLDVLAGYKTGDAWWAPPPERPFTEEAGRPPGRLRIAVTSKPSFETPVAPGNIAGVERAARLLAELGHDVVEASPADWPEEVVEGFFITWAVRTCGNEPMPPFESLEPVNQALIEFGRSVDAPTFDKANRSILKASRELVAFFDDFDVLVTPTVAGPPPIIGSYRDPNDPIAEFLNAASLVPFTPPWNTTGQPAVSVPLHWDDQGLPVGVQIVGRPADEATLIRVSAQLEEAAPWADRRPPLT
ncbi:MAG: amidase [Actinomycetota bacterium]